VASPNLKSTSIELENVCISFAGEPLLRGVNLSIAVGEVLVLIGPSGAGKSTLMKVMSGLIPPTSGSVRVQGKELHALRREERDLVMRQMGMLFQKNALFDSLTVFDNVAFPLREVTCLNETEVAETVHYYLESVGLSSSKDLFPDEISGGMQKRLGIARALALRPKLVFYDDPTAGLDPITSRRIVQLILSLQKTDGATVVAITNDMNRA
jgi:phospholipid/cholesterol/gamma-HCH transport system ATP-binding protein